MSFNPLQTVNVAATSVINGAIVQNSPPIFPWGGSFLPVGVQSTPGLSRGALANTGVYFTNTDISHACDARFVLDFKFDLSGMSIPNLGIIGKAIQNGKNAAANAVRAAMSQLVGELRLAMDGILISVSLDPSGELSKLFSVLKDATRKINEKLAQIAQIVSDIAFFYYLVQDLEQIVTWIESLPTKLKDMIMQCLTNFTNSLAVVKSQVSGSLQQMQTTITSSLNSQLTASQSMSSAQSVGVDPAIVSAVSDPLNSNAADINSAITPYIAAGAAAASNTMSSLFSTSQSP